MQNIHRDLSPRRDHATTEHPLVRKLGHYVTLSDAERQAVTAAMPIPRRLAAHDEVPTETAAAGGTVVLLSGFAYRAKLMADGRRQIVAFMVPGDFSDLHVGLLRRLDYSIVAASSATIAIIGGNTVAELTHAHPRLAQAFRISRLVDEAVMREWLVNLGQRTAFERTAALLCEIHMRLSAAGLARNGLCDFPFTQAELAETLGLSAVHINRTLQELRRQGLIRLAERRLHIQDLDGLAAAAMFDSTYLHLEQKRR